MGLRIIDRPRFIHHPTEDEQNQQLALEMQQWSVSRGGLDRETEQEFLQNFKNAKARIGSEEQILDLASRIETSIRKAYVLRTTCHSKVDIATLLALL